MPRTKMTRHQLKEQDEITTSLQRFTELVYTHKREFILGAGTLIVVVLAVFGWVYYSSNRTIAAQTQLSAAIAAFNDTAKPEKERYQAAIAEADKTISSYGSLPLASIAQYYKGLSYDGLGDNAKATEALQRAINDAGPDVRSVAQFALAGVYLKNGETAKAIEAYKQLYDGGGYSKAAVGYELATLYEANNQADQAKEIYQKIVTEFPESPFRQSADQALKRLGVTTPPPTPEKPS